MKYSFALILSLLAVASVSFASSTSIYTDDTRFDYSLEDVTYGYDALEDIALAVPVYVYFEEPTVDGALRIHFATEDTFSTDLAPLFVSVPDESTDLADITELDISANKTEDVSIEITNMSLNEVEAEYLSKFEELGYDVELIEEDVYSIALLNSAYVVNFVEGDAAITVSIDGV